MDELVIIVGSAQYSHQLVNPFTAGERLVMIRRVMEEVKIDLKRIWVVPIPDVHLHMTWVSTVKGYTPLFHIAYSNEPLTRRLFLEAGYEVRPIPFKERKQYSSTEIRRRILTGENWEELVPTTVAAFITEIKGISRLQDLTKNDKP
jgi:nicotinamide-nucleotide adenylyltransferase